MIFIDSTKGQSNSDNATCSHVLTGTTYSIPISYDVRCNLWTKDYPLTNLKNYWYAFGCFRVNLQNLEYHCF